MRIWAFGRTLSVKFLPASSLALDSFLSQLKSGYAGLTVIERFDRTLRFSIQSLNFQLDPAVPGQPQFKKTVAQG